MEERKYIVYKHTSPSNKVYIGLTRRTLEERSGSNGIHYKKNNNFCFWRAIEKYGWSNFTHEILKSNLTKEEASEMEQYYIKLYKSNDRNYGYNLTSGGEANFEPTKETKELIAQKSKEQWRNPQIREKMIERLKISHKGVFTEKQRKSAMKRRGKPLPKERVEKMKGKPAWNKGLKNCYSQEALERMSKAHINKPPTNKGTHLNEEQKKIISIRTKEALKDPIIKQKLRDNCKKQTGIRFKFYVYQYDLNGNLIEIHNGCANAGRKLNVEKSGINNCIYGKTKTAYGFIWKKKTKEEYENEHRIK